MAKGHSDLEPVHQNPTDWNRENLYHFDQNVLRKINWTEKQFPVLPFNRIHLDKHHSNRELRLNKKSITLKNNKFSILKHETINQNALSSSKSKLNHDQHQNQHTDIWTSKSTYRYLDQPNEGHNPTDQLNLQKKLNGKLLDSSSVTCTKSETFARENFVI